MLVTRAILCIQAVLLVRMRACRAVRMIDCCLMVGYACIVDALHDAACDTKIGKIRA